MQRDIAEQQRVLAQRRQQLDGAREELTRRRIELAERVRDENARAAELKRIEPNWLSAARVWSAPGAS